MAYKPLKGLRGVQTDFNKYRFTWDSAGNDYQAHFLWVYKEDELNRPYMLKYAQCINNCVQTTFQYNNVSLQEIRKIRFLVFLSDQQSALSREEMQMLSQQPEFLCEVCCGSGEAEWNWIQEQSGVSLAVNSNKIIPEGILYYEYSYGNKLFQFELPGEIKCGENYYRNIFFPRDLSEIPRLKSRVPNLKLVPWNKKVQGKAPAKQKKSGFLDKLVDAIRK